MTHPAVAALETRLSGFLDERGLTLVQEPSPSPAAEDDEFALVHRDGRKSTTAIQVEDTGGYSVGTVIYETEELDDGWTVVKLSQFDHSPSVHAEAWDDLADEVRRALDAGYRPFARMGPKEIDDHVLIAAALRMKAMGATDVVGVEGRTDTVKANLGGEDVTVVAEGGWLKVSDGDDWTHLVADDGSNLSEAFEAWVSRLAPDTAPTV